MRVLWELNTQPFALLTQCSTTEPQEHYIVQYEKLIFSDLLKTTFNSVIKFLQINLQWALYHCKMYINIAEVTMHS